MIPTPRQVLGYGRSKVSGIADEATFRARLEECLGCEKLVKENEGYLPDRLFCGGGCGCGKRKEAELHTKLRFNYLTCPLRKPGFSNERNPMSIQIPRQKHPESWESIGQSSSMPIVVSYFTDLFYLREAFDLVRSCQAVGLDFLVRQVIDERSWEKNTNFKPTFLMRLAERFPTRALLWLDADARVRRTPELLRDLNVPVAYCTYDNRHPLSGTVYLGPGEDRRVLLSAWREAVFQAPRATDQVGLGEAVRKTLNSHLELPPEYCWIYDISLRKPVPSPLLASPVIEHMQASRWTKGRLK